MKQIYTELSLENQVLKDSVQKTAKLDEHRELATYAIQEHRPSERQACRMFKLSCSAYRYLARNSDDEEIKQVLSEVVARKPRWGSRKLEK